MGDEKMQRTISAMVGKGSVNHNTGQYPVLHITSEGLKYVELFTPRIARNLLKWLETEADRRLLDLSLIHI